MLRREDRQTTQRQEKKNLQLATEERTDGSKEKKKKKTSHGSAGGRPSLARPHRERSARHSVSKPATPHARGTGVPSPLSGQDSSPRCSFPRHHRQRRPGGGSRGTGHDTTWLGLRHLKGRPGALQGHQPRANSARTPNGGRRVRRDSGTPPPRRGEGRLARRSREGYSAESVRSVRETTGVNNRGQAGFRTPLPSLPHTATGRGRGERRGARGQSEKSDPIRQGMSVPRLARLRPGPGERNVTTSIKRRQKQQGKRGEHSRPKRACGSAFFFFFFKSPATTFLSQAEVRSARSAGTGPET